MEMSSDRAIEQLRMAVHGTLNPLQAPSNSFRLRKASHELHRQAEVPPELLEVQSIEFRFGFQSSDASWFLAALPARMRGARHVLQRAFDRWIDSRRDQPPT